MSSNTDVHARAHAILQKVSVAYGMPSVYEVILAHVYKTWFGSLSSLEARIFRRFRDYWSKFNPGNFQVMQVDEMVYGSLPTTASWLQPLLKKPS